MPERERLQAYTIVAAFKGPAWRAYDTADVTFNIDNSPERNGLWSFRKILSVLFSLLTTISWPSAWIRAIHQRNLMGRSPQSSYRLQWNELCLWKQAWHICSKRLWRYIIVNVESFQISFEFLEWLYGVLKALKKDVCSKREAADIVI